MHWWPKVQISGTGLTIVSTVAPSLGIPIPYGVLVGLVSFGGLLIAWPIVVAAVQMIALPFQRPPLLLFLPRDSESDQLGIQTFPGVSFIQVAVSVGRSVTECRASILKIEYAEPNSVFALEHNEPRACRWSDRTELEIDLDPAHSGTRFNVATFTSEGLQLYPETPTNLFPKLTRVGLHRFQIKLSYHQNGRPTAQSTAVNVDWRGPDKPTIVNLEIA
jgi:hypothetical protein